MTDTPSRPPETPDAPESATTETPVRPGIPAQATGPAPAPGPAAPSWGTAPGWGAFPPAPVPGWEWSNGWVPKPGIIALRPLRVSDILGASFSLLRAHWRTILPFTAVIALVTEVATTLITDIGPQPPKTSSPFATSQDPAADLHRNVSALADTVPLLGVIELISTVAGILVTAVMILIVSKAVIGRPAPLAEVWQSVRGRLAQILGLGTVVAVILGGILALGFGPVFAARDNGSSDATLSGLAVLMLPCLGVALWISVSILFAAPALMLERQGIRSALARSFRLVRGSWWRVMGITLLMLILTSIIQGMISIPFILGAFLTQGFSLDSTSIAYQVLACIGGTIGMALTVPVLSGGTALLYMDQRIRRESLDVSLAAAAGVPNYTHTEAV